jgi:hypothetical protein
MPECGVELELLFILDFYYYFFNPYLHAEVLVPNTA